MRFSGWLGGLLLLLAGPAAAEEPKDEVQTFVSAGVVGITAFNPLGRDEPGPDPDYDFSVGRSAAFNLQYADSFAAGLALDFVGLKLDEEVTRWAARLAWGSVYLHLEQASLQGEVDGARFDYDYDTYLLLWADPRSALSHGVGVIRRSEPRGSWYTAGYGADDAYDEYMRDPKVTETAFGYVMKMDSMLAALRDGYVMGGLGHAPDPAGGGVSFVVDLMVLAGFAWVSPSDEYGEKMKAAFDVSPEGSLTIAAYSQAEALFLYYSGGEHLRWALTFGGRLRLAGAGGGEPAGGVTYGVAPILHVGPVARLGLSF